MHSGTLFVLRLMCLQQKALHQTSMHCACRFCHKNIGRAMGGASPNPPKYVIAFEIFDVQVL